MEAVPRLPMLSFPLKTSPEGTSFSSLKKYIAECYQENPELFSKEVFALETLRNAAMHPSKDVAGCATLKRYYCQLNSLANRFPQALERNLFTFTWKDLYANNTLEITDFRYEMAAVLFNIAGHHTQLGASVDRSDPDGMKLACTHFQIAAWSYGELREKYQGINGNNDFMTPELLLFMQQVSLAHAQECILEKSLIDNRKPAIVAKVTAQIVCYYGAALAAMLSGGDDGTIADVVGNSVFKEWKKYVRFKTAYLNCILFLYQGQQSEEQQKMGERVVLYQAAWDNLEEARKESKGLANQKEIAETLTFTADVVEGKRKAAKSENEFIYHEAVPELKDIAAVQGANLVNGINFSVTDPEVAGEDIFARLIPMKAHEASSMYSEEKAQLLRKVGGEVTDKDNELNSFMSSLSIDNLNVSEERANKIPQGIVDRCASINAKPNAITDLITSMTNLAEICADVETNLKEIRELLNREEINEKKYQQESGVHRANTHFAELSREFQKYMEAHQKAGDSNDTLRRAMELHVNNLRILAKPLQEIQQSVPKLSGDISENIFHDLKLVLNKVNEMKAQRAQFCADLRIAINDDDITSKIIAYGEENDIKDLFKKEMGKHDKLVALIEQNLKAQENILAALTTQYAKVAPILKTINDVKHKRDNFFSSLAASYDVYEDLLAKSAKGLEFYKKLQGNVQKLLARVKAACDVQNEERQQRMSSTRPRVSNYAAPQNHATKSTAPKLKDYLKAGKKASTTDTTYIPPVRPSPLGSEAAPPAACIAPTSTYFPSQSQMQPPTSDYPPPPYTPPTQQYFDTNGYTNPIYQNNSISSTAGMMKYDYNYGGYDQYQNQMSQYPNMQGVMGAPMASQHYSNVQGSGSTSVSSQQPQYPNAHGGINSSVSSQPQQHPNASTVASSVSNHALTQQTTTTPQQSSQQYQYPVVPDQTSNAAYQASPLNYQYAQQPVNSSAPYSNQTSNYMQTYSPATQQPYSQTNQHTQVTQSDSSTTCPSSVPNSTNLYTQSTWPSQAVTTGFENLSIGNQGYQQPSTTDYSMTNNVTQQPTANLPYPNNANAIGPVYPSTDSWSTAVSTAPTQLPAQNTTSNAYPGPQNLTNQTTPTPDLPTATNYTTQQQSIDYIQSHAKTKTHGFETSPYSAQSGGYVYNQSAESGNYSGVGYQPTTSEQGNAYSSLTAPAVTNAMAIGQSGLNQYPTADNNASTSQTYSQHLQTAFTQNPVGNTTDYYALPGSYQQSTQQYAMPQTEATQQGYNNSNIPNATNYVQTVQTNGNYPQNVQNPTAAPQSAPEAPKQQPTSLPAKKPDSKHKTSKKTSNIDLLSDIDFSANLPTPPLQPQVATPQSTENSICNEQLSSTAGSQPLQPQPAELQIPVSVQQPEEQPIATDSPAPPAPLPTLNDRKQSCDNISLCSDLSSLANESFDWDSVSLRSEQIPAAVRQQTSDSNTAATVKIRNPFDDPKVVKYFHKEVERYEKMIESLNVKMLNGNTPLVNKWKELQDLLVRDEAKRTTSIGKLFPEKNRSTDCIPYDHARVVLERSTDDYINAAFVKNLGPGCPTFIVAQTPLQNTVNDFWSMIWQQKARTVVCLHTPNEILDTFWPGDLNKEMHFDDFSVTLVNQFDLSHCTELNLKLTMHGADAILDLSLIQIKAWTKSSPVQILGIAQNILVAYKQRSQEFNSTAPLIMNCLTGSERSGLIALAICGILATQSKRPILINVVDVWYRICSQRKSALRDTNNLELSMQIVLSHGHDLLNKRGIMTSYQMKNIQRTTSVEKEEVKDPFSDLDPLWKLKQKP